MGLINCLGPKHSGSVAVALAMPTVVVVILLIALSAPHLTTHFLEPRHQSFTTVWVQFVGVILALSGAESVANLTGVMPNLDAKTLAIIGPHLRFGEKLAKFLSQIAPKRAESLNINYSGKVNEVDTTAITRAALKGFLQIAGGREINEVNALAFAETLGLKVSESRLSAPGDYTDMLELSAAGEGRTVSVGGAFFGATPRIVSINSRPVEARPQGVVLVLENTDRPGMVGRIGTLLGEHVQANNFRNCRRFHPSGGVVELSSQ